MSDAESTPIGRLIQRFSKDLDQVDQQLPSSMGQLLASVLQISANMAAICVVTPSFSIVMGIVTSIYMYIINYYRPISRDMKRLDSLSRSPIYSHFSETLGGLFVLRSFRREDMYKTTNAARIDDNMSAYFALKSIDRWLCVRLESLGNLVVLFASVLAVLTGSRAGTAGLSLNNALGITTLLNWAVRNAAETESLMNSVERVYHIVDETPQEKTSVLKEDAANNGMDAAIQLSGWPQYGALSFSSMSMRYRPDFEPVLRDVNLYIRPGERIGIVGRTGSGKR
ncbi:hypothetical protein EON64_01125 [archaeon]|nr:MAG: hypothetical protein EON64_01125 [archaeon]